MVEESSSNQNGEVLQELRIIRSMIEKTKQRTADNGIYMVVWGWLAFLGCIATYALTVFRQYHFIWIPWAAVVGLGTISNIVLPKRGSENGHAKTYIGNAMMNLWIACGVGMTIIGFVGSLSPNISYRPIFPVISIILGIGAFASGGIVDWRPLRIIGVVWWAGAIVMMFAPVLYHSLIMAVVIVPAYLVPGHLLRAQYKRAIRNEQVSTT
ncbi:hypothetical protein E3J62_00115 [candidate division TA06 bacterium]|uniref:Uncharacterized protein n=1 Tax=candidate division TA06 bacterium TaxID=2250710 RepID=A0A523UZA2_UNCT6|nr:MAG: hypothetical protein E3J62_00115 [candidate division TA06 bacterium]